VSILQRTGSSLCFDSGFFEVAVVPTRKVLMNEEELKKLFEPFAHQDNPSPTLAILIYETVKLRDRIMESTGRTLTVGDTTTALAALTAWLSGHISEEPLSDDQQALLAVWQSRLLEPEENRNE